MHCFSFIFRFGLLLNGKLWPYLHSFPYLHLFKLKYLHLICFLWPMATIICFWSTSSDTVLKSHNLHLMFLDWWWLTWCIFMMFSFFVLKLQLLQTKVFSSNFFHCFACFSSLCIFSSFLVLQVKLHTSHLFSQGGCFLLMCFLRCSFVLQFTSQKMHWISAPSDDCICGFLVLSFFSVAELPSEDLFTVCLWFLFS